MISRFTGRPEPVLIAMAGVVVLILLGLMGLVIWRGVDLATAGAVGTIIAPISLAVGVWVRSKVTPKAAPQDDMGNNLVPEEQGNNLVPEEQ